MLPFTVQASETNTEITYFEDGSYVVSETEIATTRMLTKVGSRSDTYYSADDVPQWKISVTGEFLYDGNTVTCTYASGVTTIYNTSKWSKTSDRASCSGNAAIYTATFDYSVFGITTHTYTWSVVLNCDENGNFY